MSVISSYREQVRRTCTSSSFFNNRVEEWHFSESFKRVLVLCWSVVQALVHYISDVQSDSFCVFHAVQFQYWNCVSLIWIVPAFWIKRAKGSNWGTAHSQNSAWWCCRTLVFCCSSSQCSISVWSWNASLLWFVKVYLGTPGYNVLRHRDSPIEIEIRRNDRLGAAQWVKVRVRVDVHRFGLEPTVQSRCWCSKKDWGCATLWRHVALDC